MKVLITGGSGLLGGLLTTRLLESGHEVAHLGRRKVRHDQITSFQWDPMTGTLEEGALKWPDAIIHLAGAGIAEKRWSKERKALILESRKRAGDLLYQGLKEDNRKLKTFIAASAIGFYGGSSSGGRFSEDDSAAEDFQGKVCKTWEEASRQVECLGARTVIFRIGVVLSRNGGAFPKMALPIKLGVGTPLGSGRQIMSWIHEDDLCDLFMMSLEEGKISGTYNAVAPHPGPKRFCIWDWKRFYHS